VQTRLPPTHPHTLAESAVGACPWPVPTRPAFSATALLASLIVGRWSADWLSAAGDLLRLSGSGRRGEAVAGATYRLQASGTVTELAAQGADHNLDDVAAAAPVVAPYVA
jgi:hypothetical protein